MTPGMKMKMITNRSNPHTNSSLRFLKGLPHIFVLSISVLMAQKVSGFTRKALFKNQSKIFRDSQCSVLERCYLHAVTGLNQYIDSDGHVALFLSAKGYCVEGKEAPWVCLLDVPR